MDTDNQIFAEGTQTIQATKETIKRFKNRERSRNKMGFTLRCLF